MTTSTLRFLAGAALTACAVTCHAAEEDAIGRFEISRFDVAGNTLLAQPRIDRILAPYTGKSRNFGDVQQALEALEAAYHAIGYHVVQVALPEQELNQGVVRLQVIETRLGKIRVEGNLHHDDVNIRRSVPGLREGMPPDLGRVSSSLKLANENPAKKTTLQLQSGERDDEVDALLKVSDEKSWRVAALIDNSGNRTTGQTQLTTQLQYANVANADQVLSLQYTTTVQKPSQVSVYGIGYHIPFYALGDSMDLFASYSDVDSGSVLAGIVNLQVSGRGTILGARYNQNLRRTGDYESRLSYGIDYREYRNNVTVQGAQLGNDVTVHPLGITYGGTWTAGQSEFNFSITGMHNLPGGERGAQADFNRVRAGARAGYNILRYNANYVRALPGDWQMRLGFTGQQTADALVPGEQFGAGGANTVRGFNERELSNDRGQLINAELYTSNLCGALTSIAAQCRALAFYDVAQVRRNDPLPGEQDSASIASVGLGMRMAVSRYMTMQLDYGRVVNAGVTQARGDSRVHVRIGLTY
ncbi:ShlB/FhaC/HecB family hemolysin secretion/activation protein [Noviherbaspirillum malthae]|uniref:ShlB/FhaC/HecB family hemolysin secretion/activation protein n=1 Tax=Noviherbaspirillum malthae TaxID=1260987 RepID=UPI00188E1339|nr:ShlB/FhaC/HecB family hemolysin secretion/activation protein [Noviherbaspirillum malthae]